MFWVTYMMDESINEKGKMGGLWFSSVNLFTNILIIVSIDLLIYTKYHTWINFVILSIITFLSYIIFLLLVHKMTIFSSVGTIKEAFSSSKLWMNLIFVGGTCGMIDFFILGFNYIFNPSSVKELQILLNKNNELEKIQINDLPKKIREKIEMYKEFKEEDDSLKKESTQKMENSNNSESLKLKIKKVSHKTSSNNLNNIENGTTIEKNSKKNNPSKRFKNFGNKDSTRDSKSKIIKKRNNYAEIDQSPSIENSHNTILGKKASVNTNINNNQRKTMSQDNKSNELSANNEIIYCNQGNLYKKIKDEDNHSGSVFINKKGKLDVINGSIIKQKHFKSIYG